MKRNKGPAPPGGRNELPAEALDGERAAQQIIRLMNSVRLTPAQAERIRSVAAVRAKIPSVQSMGIDGVLAVVERGTYDRDGAKRIAMRALARAMDKVVEP